METSGDASREFVFHWSLISHPRIIPTTNVGRGAHNLFSWIFYSFVRFSGYTGLFIGTAKNIKTECFITLKGSIAKDPAWNSWDLGSCSTDKINLKLKYSRGSPILTFKNPFVELY